MKLQFNIKHGNNTHEVTTLPADIICWERMTKQKFSALFGENVGLEDMAVMAWSALKRQQPNIAPFEVWIDELEELEVVDEVVDPTQAEASTDSV